jgi:hypothetical protein
MQSLKSKYEQQEMKVSEGFGTDWKRNWTNLLQKKKSQT